MANKVYGASSLTGGLTGALDAINGSIINEGDLAAVLVNDDQAYFYILDADSGVAESSPRIISPDTNAGNKRWIRIGPKTDCLSNYVDLNTAITAIGATEKTLIIDKASNLTENATIPSTLHIISLKNCVQDGTYTLTINGPFEAGLYQVFGDSITVSFGPGAVKEVYPEWWGDNTTPGTTDMTAEIQTAITSLSNGGIVNFSPTTYLVSSAITVDDDITIEGYGFSSIIKTTTLDIKIFSGDTKSRLTFKNFKIDGDRKGDGVSGNTNIANIWLETCNDVLIDGIYFLGAEYLAIATFTGNRQTITNCFFDGPVAEGITCWSDYVNIIGNHFLDCPYNAIVTKKADNVNIAENTFKNCGITGTDAVIAIGQDSNVASKNITISDNSFSADNYRPISIVGNGTDSVENVTVRGNTFLDASGTHMIEADYVKGLVVSANICENGATARDIYVTHGEDVVIANNICRNSVNGIQIGVVTDCIVEGNLISTASISGIVVAGSSGDRLSITGNRTRNCATYGIHISSWAHVLKLANNDDSGSGAAFHNDDSLNQLYAYGNNFEVKETISSDGALSIWIASDLDSSGAALALTLADGNRVGQQKMISMSVAGNNADVTIAHHETADSEVARFDAVDEYLLLAWTGTEWATVSNSCTFP